jgi:hypothetical protein
VDHRPACVEQARNRGSTAAPLPDWESYGVTEFESGEVVERTLDLYGHPDQPDDVCLEPGEHQFGVGFAYAESHTDV